MKLSETSLFKGLTENEVEEYIKKHNGVYKNYSNKEYIFMQNDEADKIYILIKGEVIICKDFYTGYRHNVAFFNEFGEVFAEVYAFLRNHNMDYGAYANVDTKVLEFPSDLFLENIGNSKVAGIVMKNFIEILAHKAYFLNQKLRILTSKSLRSKLANMIVLHSEHKGYWLCNMTRDTLADYLNVARPSLSRELMKMQKEGLINIDGAKIYILDEKSLNQHL